METFKKQKKTSSLINFKAFLNRLQKMNLKQNKKLFKAHLMKSQKNLNFFKIVLLKLNKKALSLAKMIINNCKAFSKVRTFKVKNSNQTLKIKS